MVHGTGCALNVSLGWWWQTGHQGAGAVAGGGVSGGVPWVASWQAAGGQQGLHALQLPRRLQLPRLPRALPLPHIAQLMHGCVCAILSDQLARQAVLRPAMQGLKQHAGR